MQSQKAILKRAESYIFTERKGWRDYGKQQKT